ncbi:MAG: radical SAM protein [Sandaracinus sp.]|nr:radical SAM protein [Sandaracinus sp.]
MSARGTRRLDVLRTRPHPAYVVWELTLACDHACRHCGSRAGEARSNELSTEDALGVVKQLADMGTREVVLIGGEAYLHEGFLDVIRALRAEGIQASMTTGGLGVTAELARAMADAGLQLASVSVDGLEETHDRQRARTGSFRAALEALRNLKDAGIATASNVNVNRGNLGELEALYEVLRDVGIRAWQVQITSPLGRAADRPEMLLQPWDLLDLVPRVVALKRRAKLDRVRVWPGNNLGYFGPEEGALRSADPDEANEHWRGCQAGRFVLGIESDGAVKGCPSLQTASYVGGHVRDRSIQSIWDESPELAFARAPRALHGYCAECAYAETCQGGCSFTAHSVLGKPGDNPYCYHRARVFRRQGLRERLVPTEAADGRPFDHGLFRVEREPFDAPDAIAPPERLVRIGRKPKRPEKSWRQDAT